MSLWTDLVGRLNIPVQSDLICRSLKLRDFGSGFATEWETHILIWFTEHGISPEIYHPHHRSFFQTPLTRFPLSEESVHMERITVSACFLVLYSENRWFFGGEMSLRNVPSEYT